MIGTGPRLDLEKTGILLGFGLDPWVYHQMLNVANQVYANQAEVYNLLQHTQLESRWELRNISWSEPGKHFFA